MSAPLPTNIRVGPSGPLIQGTALGQVLAWTGVGWDLEQLPVVGFDHVITSRADLVAVAAPVAGVFTLPNGSYLFAGPVTLAAGERIVWPAVGWVQGLGATAPLTGDATPQQLTLVNAGSDIELVGLHVSNGGTGPALALAGGALVRCAGCRFAAPLAPQAVVLGAAAVAYLDRCLVGTPATVQRSVFNAGVLLLSNCELYGEVATNAGELVMIGGSITPEATQDCVDVLGAASVNLVGATLIGGVNGVGVNTASEVVLQMNGTLSRNQSGAGLVRRAGASDGSWILNGVTVDGAQSAVELDAATDVPANGGLIIFAASMRTVGAAYVNFASTDARVNIKGNLSSSGLITETAIVP